MREIIWILCLFYKGQAVSLELRGHNQLLQKEKTHLTGNCLFASQLTVAAMDILDIRMAPLKLSKCYWTKFWWLNIFMDFLGSGASRDAVITQFGRYVQLASKAWW